MLSLKRIEFGINQGGKVAQVNTWVVGIVKKYGWSGITRREACARLNLDGVAVSGPQLDQQPIQIVRTDGTRCTNHYGYIHDAKPPDLARRLKA